MAFKVFRYFTTNFKAFSSILKGFVYRYSRPVCVTKYRPKCVPYTDQECKIESRTVCETLTRENCYDAFRDVSQPYEEDECKDEVVRSCEKGWVGTVSTLVKCGKANPTQYLW